MAHTLASDKAISTRDIEEPDVCVIDKDQEDEIIRLRNSLRLTHKDKLLPPSHADVIPPTPPYSRKRTRPASWSDSEELPKRRMRSDNSDFAKSISHHASDVTNTSTATTTTTTNFNNGKAPFNLMNQLSDDLLIEIFKHLPQFPYLLQIRQVCERWRQLSTSPRLWTSLSFEGHEHVTSTNLLALCNMKPSLSFLRKLSLAKVHSVDESAVRMIPRTECAATLESVDLSWCSGATDKSVVEFSRCPGLRELRLSHCKQVTRRSVRILAVRCPRLEVLDLNCISGLRDSVLSFIGENCPYLRVLNIANGRNITDEGVAHIAKGCTGLEELDLSWCGRVTDWAISKIAASCPQLREIGLSETSVRRAGLVDLTQLCPRLEVIQLARCTEIKNECIDSIITHCSERLTFLNVASCEHVSDDYVEKLVVSCPKLKCLDVSKLPCRFISDMVEKLTANRDILVYY